jgi:hypothetical protein
MREFDFQRAITMPLEILEQVAEYAAERERKAEAAYYAAKNHAADAHNTLQAARWLVSRGRRNRDGVRRAS